MKIIVGSRYYLQPAAFSTCVGFTLSSSARIASRFSIRMVVV